MIAGLRSWARRPALHAALLTTVLLLTTSGCADGDRLTELDDAVDATLALDAVDIDITGSTLLNTTPTGSFALEGRADLADDRHAFTVENRPVGADPFSAEIISDGDRVLISGMPTFGEQWVEVTGAPEAHSSDLAVFLDVEAMLTLIAGLEGDVIDEGEQLVRGVRTRELSFSLPDSRLERRIRETIALVEEALPQEVEATGDIVASGDVSVWIDDDGLIRQLQLRVGAGLGLTQAIPGTGAIDYSLLLSIVPVEDIPRIELPEPDQTVRFADLISPT